MAQKENAMNEQLVLYKELTNIQLDMTLSALTQNITSDSEAAIRQKITWRDQLVSQMEVLQYDAARIQHVREQINHGIHRYLMEQLNQTVIQALLGLFVRPAPRHEWTDSLFVSELETFLEKDALLNDEIKQRLHVLKVFDQSGVLL